MGFTFACCVNWQLLIRWDPFQYTEAHPQNHCGPPSQSASDLQICVLPVWSPDSPASLSLLVLYIVLGVAAGGIVLCWCCWSPGWFLWRVSICRFLPCCNTACASCQLCAHSKDHRLAKVTPHPPANGAPTGTVAVTTGAEENVTTAAV